MSNNNNNDWKSVQNKPRTGRKTQSNSATSTTPTGSSTSSSLFSSASSSTTSGSTSGSSAVGSNSINYNVVAATGYKTAAVVSVPNLESRGTSMQHHHHNNLSVPSSSSSSSSASSTNQPLDKHPLGHTFTFSYFRKEKGIDYEDCMKTVGDFSTVEEFWALYTHMKRPYELKVSMDYHLFKQGIKPMWEDEKNKNGGRLMLRCKSGYSARIWEDLLLSFIGQQFTNDDDINGVVISIRDNHDIISIWNKNGDDEKIQETLKHDVMTLLNLPSQTKLEYKAHKDAIQTHTKMLELWGSNFKPSDDTDIQDDADLTESNQIEETTKQR
ncbi:hypothetical protein C9374_007892 [Naegleria lovaniensis]|uniref:Uncharacterized protein n=1 Tax=Naegleria lovaniensis TaxID=51637 RepID=A0AA88GG31_NAELO|nr:uncharacterized protein C9374_007892 [Naegleria lovaniensis]KAG2378744.1 hypothetical protein C9374_007892 [Naegleria lovaniensis]